MQTDRLVERDNINETAPLVSVIVPIYNVERYVRKCLDSLKEQTLREIEVICIDDGSTDGSGKIADEFARNDQRFRVIHTENRGLSAARNRGIDESRAEWLMFVDSDDWVDRDFCKVPFEAAIEYGADLVCFGAYRVTRWSRVKKPKKSDTPTGIVDEMTAHEYGGVPTWNKLYKHTLFSDIRFPERHVYEDLDTAHRFVKTAETIVLLTDQLYYYFDRKGSICHTYKDIYKRDGFVFALNRYEYLTEHGYPSEKIEWLLQRYAIGFLTSTRLNQDSVYVRAQEVTNNIIGIPKEFSINQKIALVTWRIDKRLFYLICKMSGRM